MKTMNLMVRIGLFSLILALGTIATLLVGETTGLALADLSGSSVQAMTRATYGDTLYAALGDSRRGIYRSDDRGHSWYLVSIPPQVTVTALAVHPTNKRILYAGTTGGADQTQSSLWYSRDGGQSWRQSMLPVNIDGQHPLISVLTVAPDHPGLVYVGTEGQGLYRFYTNRDEYERIGGPALQNLYVKDVVINPNSLVYAITTEGLMVIKGAAWRKLEPLPDGVVSLVVDAANPLTLYIGTVGYGVHRSTDGGQSWQAINAGLDWQPGIILRGSAIAVDQENPQHLALATAFSVGSHLTGDGIYESFDAGEKWIRLAESREPVNRLAIKEGGIYAATAKGLVRYGEPLMPVSPVSSTRFVSFIDNLTGIQTSILVLTVVLAGLVLVGRVEWLLRRGQATT